MNRKGVQFGFSRIIRFLENYTYYRGLGWPRKKAWHLASQTIPF